MYQNNHSILTDTCILVPSWDGYQDLWWPFFCCFFKYWPDCPFPLFLGANQAKYDDPRVKMLTVEPKTDYSSSLIRFLIQLSFTWVIVWVEDLFLRRKVDTSGLNEVLQWAKARNAAHLRLLEGGQSLVSLAASYYPQPDMPGIGLIPRGARYRAGLTVGLWRKDILLGLLREGESAWDFEYQATVRSRLMSEPFFSLIGQNYSTSSIGVVNSVRKGLWTLEGAEFLKREGLSYMLGSRKQEPRLQSVYFTHIKPPVKRAIFGVWYAFNYKRGAWI